LESGELENFELEDFPMNGDEQHLEIVIRTFNELPIKRPYQEFCKPFNQEILTQDYDEVCALAITVARRLLGNRVDYFQLKMVETISEVMIPIE
jgi:hypothetical protein